MSTDAANALLAATGPRPQAKRDRWGRPIIPDPITGEETSWTRATSMAKVLDDEYNLRNYVGRNVAHGIGLRRDLYALAASIPLDDKRGLNDLVEQASEAAGASAKANLGTALHAFTERYDKGESLDDINAPQPWDADLYAYVQKLDECGVRIVRTMVEQMTTLHEHRIAGTGDRHVHIDGQRLPMVGDLKTGGYDARNDRCNLNFQAIAVQLAIYAYSDTKFNLTTGEHEPMPEVDKTRAMVIWLPVGQARCELFLVDIEAGREALEHSAWAHNWRKRNDLHTVFPGTIGTPPLRLVEPVAEVAQSVDAPVSTPAPTTLAPLPAFADEAAAPDVVDAVRERARAIIAAGHGDALAAAWPEGVPTFKQGGHGQSDIEAIGRACADVERDKSLPFVDDAAARPEYIAADDPRVADVQRRLGRLPADLAGDVLNAALRQQCPKLSSGFAKPADLAIVVELLTNAELAQGDRNAVVGNLLDGFAGDAESVAAMCSAAAEGRDGAERRNLTAVEVDKLGVLVAAIDLCVVGFTYDGDVPALMTTDSAEAHIVSRYGTKKDALAAAKDVATALGKNKPRSVSAISTDPLLTAHVAVLPLDTPTDPQTKESTA